jgi:hypothetical protein
VRAFDAGFRFGFGIGGCDPECVTVVVVANDAVMEIKTKFAELPELVRTAAYWQYGPVSPSNDSASLKSKAITVLRVNFSRK